MTPGASRYLARLLAERQQHEVEPNTTGDAVFRVEIQAECIEDPSAAIEDYLRELSQAEFGPLPRADMRPETGARRPCCTAMLRGMDHLLAHWRYPQTVSCPECQAVYEIAPRAVMSTLGRG